MNDAASILEIARVLQAHELLGLLGQIEVQCKAGEAMGGLVQMVQAELPPAAPASNPTFSARPRS